MPATHQNHRQIAGPVYLSRVNNLSTAGPPTAQRILVLGVGNPVRSDDGAGAFVCAALAAQNLPGVCTRTVHQLDPALLEDLFAFDAVVIVDAAVTGEGFSFAPLVENNARAVASSHHLNAQTLQALARAVYNRSLSFYLCAIRGENFDLGETLSPAAKKNAGEAIQVLTGWLSASNR